MEQPLNDFVIGKVRRPAIGGGDGLIKFAVSVVEPSWALVVKLGLSSLFL